MKVIGFYSLDYSSNVYLVVGKSCALIDTGTGQGIYFNRLVEQIKDYLDKIVYIILTHCHYDHTGGAKKLQKLTGADVYIHKDESAILLRGNNVISGARMFGGSLEPTDIKLLTNNDIIDLGYKLKIIHTPGHTKGSICIYEKTTYALFSGDLVFANGDFGRYDLPTGDFEALVNSCKLISTLDVIALYPGHGEYITNNGISHIKLALQNMQKYWYEKI